MSGKSPWTPERVELLRRLRCVEGLDPRRIAKALTLTGHKFTRNAVIAKCDREGFEPPSKIPNTTKKAPVLHIDRSREIGAPRSDTNVRFIDKADWQCQMFVGGESHETGLVCGRAREDGKPYCKSCAAIAYEPEEKRRAG